MKILITGANGYIGRHIVNCLLNNGNDVIACDINTENIDPRATLLKMNIFKNTEDNLFETLGKPDVCLHLAWRNGFVHNADTHIGDLSAHYKFINNMIQGGLKHIAIMGSMHEVGYWEGPIDENTPCKPLSMYGIAKNALRQSIELLCDQKNIIFQWLRCFYVVGDDKFNNSIFCKILKAVEEKKKTFPFNSGKNKYDFINIDELAVIISKTITQNKINGIINCCLGNPISLADRVEQFIKENNLNIELDYGVYPDRPYDSPCIYGDTTKLKKIFNL